MQLYFTLYTVILKQKIRFHPLFCCLETLHAKKPNSNYDYSQLGQE